MIALSPLQRKVLAYIEDEMGMVFDHSPANLKMIAHHIGAGHGHASQSAIEVLYSLRHKGYLESRGASKKRPERWWVRKSEGES